MIQLAILIWAAQLKFLGIYFCVQTKLFEGCLSVSKHHSEASKVASSVRTSPFCNAIQLPSLFCWHQLRACSCSRSSFGVYKSSPGRAAFQSQLFFECDINFRISSGKISKVFARRRHICFCFACRLLSMVIYLIFLRTLQALCFSKTPSPQISTVLLQTLLKA